MERKKLSEDNFFVKSISSIEDLSILKGEFKNNNFYCALYGLLTTARAHFIYGMSHDVLKKLVISSDEQSARKLCEEYRFYEPDCVYFPAKDTLFYQSDLRSNELTTERIKAVSAILSDKQVTVFTTIEALMNKMVPQEKMGAGAFSISVSDEINLGAVRKHLVEIGYESAVNVSGPGEFAVRGGILDLFPLTSDYPYRIELWGDEVDSIRRFDPLSQKSIDTAEDFEIYPATELVLSDEVIKDGLSKIKLDESKLYESLRKEMKTSEAYMLHQMYSDSVNDSVEFKEYDRLEGLLPYFYDSLDSILDYFPKDTMVFTEAPDRIKDLSLECENEFNASMQRRLELGQLLPKQMSLLFSQKEIFEKLLEYKGVVFAGATANSSKKIIPIKKEIRIDTRPVVVFNNTISLLKKELEEYKKKKYRVVVIGASRTRQKRLCDGLVNDGINCFYSENYYQELLPGQILVSYGNLERSVEYTDSGYVFISDNDIFGEENKRKKKKKYKNKDAIRSFEELNVGDYVVHENYGLGIYQGLEKIEQDHVIKDYIKISYAKEANLYVQVTQLDLITKYTNTKERKPKLNSLGNIEWIQTKTRVKKAVGDVAKELVDLYALRQQEKGYVYGEDTSWQKEFEETFPYEETDGQTEAIEEVKNDLMSTKIMDRLICGDVGFGKTEIALRAAFKVVQENKQVVFLCPTTILAQQHYNTFVSRMKSYPINIGMLSRFRSDAQNRRTVEELKSGAIDIVVGTHRALSKDVSYHDLGLLVIDEEQRFGVKHKEKIKQIKKNIDVLSLTATPIPRTLHMSLIGIRDMSILEEAPLERQPVQTYVFEYNEELVREAIQREISRGGQVYYVINRVRQIPDIAAGVQKLVPDANVVYAHGKMPEQKLENIMEDFIDRRIDVLVATTIIEIGLDISNVNTIIIHDADKLGLSQLYQLRGRVGRSNRRAYAFLMYKKDKVLKEVAMKRLNAINEFTELGSGFKIAMRDLEIRGAGNLLGQEQHGHMEAVGYDLYCKLLAAAIKAGKSDMSDGTDGMEFETAVEIDVDAYMPDSYIENEEQKLEIYKRISQICNHKEQEDIVDELIDRFGEPPQSVMNLIYVSRLRHLSHQNYLSKVKQNGNRIKFYITPSANINPANIPGFIEFYRGRVTFEADKNAPSFEYNLKNILKGKSLLKELFDFVENMSTQLVENLAS